MTSEVFGDQADMVELLWGQRARPSRGPKPALSVERIAAAAMAIADTEGLGAISMQRVASDLDFTKMSLYRYVAGKAELMAVMIELAVGDPPDLELVRGGWRPRVEYWAEQMWETWDRHPWLPGATIGDRIMGPKEVGWIEAAVGALAGIGLDGGEQIDTVFVLCGHIRNTQSMATSGTQPWTADRQFSPAMGELLQQYDDRFPALTAAIAGATDSPRDIGREYGLRRILDGVATVIASRS